jgi:hypothetical protein
MFLDIGALQSGAGLDIGALQSSSAPPPAAQVPKMDYQSPAIMAQ